MPDMEGDEERDVTRGSTESDKEVSLPAQNLHITVSRIRTDDDKYETRIWLNRRVRRFYAMGLLTEALSMLTSANSECEWCSDTPGCFPDTSQQNQEDDDDDEDDDGDGEPAIKPYSPVLQ